MDGMRFFQLTLSRNSERNFSHVQRMPVATIAPAFNVTASLSAVERNLTGEVLRMPESFGFWSVITLMFCAVLVVFTVVGNICVIVAVHQSKALQAPQNKLIVSLAYADLLVGLVVMPFAAIYDFVGFWILGAIPCDIWNLLDVCLCTSSILHLVVIALDRYFSITNMRYIQNRSVNMMYGAIALIWVLSAVLATGPVMGWRDDQYDERISLGICLVSQDISFQIFGTAFAFYLPLIGILILYGLIFQRTRSRVRKRMETTLACTLQEIGKIERDPVSVYPSVPTTPTSHPSTPTQMTTTFRNGNWRTRLKFPRGSPRKRYGSPRRQKRTSFGGSTTDVTRSRRNSSSQSFHSDEEAPVASVLVRKISNGTILTSNSGESVKGTKKGLGLSVRHQTLLRREKKAATTLAIITISFVACWLPFFIYAIVRPVCGDECVLPHIVEAVFLWLGYVNSTLNPIIYTIFSPDFRTAFKKMFRLEKR